MFSQRSNKKVLAVTYGSMLFEGTLNTVMVSLMVLLADHYGVDASRISILISLKGLGTILVLYFSGRLSDRYGRRNVIFVGLLFFVVFIAGMLLSRSFALAMVFAFLAGIGHGLMDAPAISILFDVFGNQAGPAMSVVQVFYSGGGVITSMLAALIITRGWPWHMLFYGYGALALIMGIIILSATYPIRGHLSSEKLARITFKKKPQLMKEGLVLGLCALLVAVTNAINFTWLPTYGNVVKGLGEGEAVRLLSSYQIGAVVGSFVFAYLLRKTHATKFMMINPFIGFLMLLGFILVNLPLLLHVFIFLFGIVMGVYFSLMINMGGELFYEHAGSATGAIGSLTMGGQTLMVVITGQLIPLVGISSIFVLSVFAAIGLSAMAVLFRRLYLSCGPVIEGIKE